MLQAAITSDIDTLASIYKGQGCRRAGGYTYAEFRMGLENFMRFLETYRVKTTMFMVGNDFLNEINHSTIRAVAAEGHEIANHTMTHAQGFRLLGPEEKEAEIAEMEKICEGVTGVRPIGFRAPGWNISDDALTILMRRGYIYDSSVFPTSLMPLMKFMHWYTTRNCSDGERTTMGQFKYMMAPVKPYRTGVRNLSKSGQNGIISFPITVSPVLRLPFFATFIMATRPCIFRAIYLSLKALRRPIQLQCHLSDFVDYGHKDLVEQVPARSDGVYVPQSLRIPLNKKMDILRRAVDMIAQDYSFTTLASWARNHA